MKTKGTVIDIKTDHVLVECERHSACETCENAEGCVHKCEKTVVRATDGVGAGIGDTVELETDTGRFLLNSFLLFILPIPVIIASYFVYSLFAGTALSAVLSVVTSAAVTFAVGRYLNAKAADKPAGRIIRTVTLKNESEIDTGNEKQGMER